MTFGDFLKQIQHIYWKSKMAYKSRINARKKWGSYYFIYIYGFYVVLGWGQLCSEFLAQGCSQGSTDFLQTWHSVGMAEAQWDRPNSSTRKRICGWGKAHSEEALEAGWRARALGHPGFCFLWAWWCFLFNQILGSAHIMSDLCELSLAAKRKESDSSSLASTSSKQALLGFVAWRIHCEPTWALSQTMSALM